MPLERVVWGPPGTGKTSSAITLVRNWMDGGTDPTRISFLAFTKAAAKAAAVKVFATEDDTRMMERFPYFRTVHSLCYRGLHKQRPDVRLIGTGDMKQFAKNFSMDGAYSVYDWEDLAEVYAQMKNQGRTEWDTALAAYQMTRVKAQSIADLDKARLMPNMEGLMMLGIQNMALNIYQEFVEKYERFKLADGLIDFTDMLEYGVREMKPFDDIKYVLLDECVPAGTKIRMADGSNKPIETIALGEKVLGVDHRTGKLTESAVVETRSKDAEELVILDGELYLTLNHPVFVVGKGYVRSGDLRPGDQIVEACENLSAVQPDVLLLAVDRLEENVLFKGVFQKAQKGQTLRGSNLQKMRTDKADDEVQRDQSEILQRHLCSGLVKNGQSVPNQKSGSAKHFENEMAYIHVRGLRKGEHDSWWSTGAEKEVLQPSMCREGKIYDRGPAKAFESFEVTQSHADSRSEGEDEPLALEKRPSAAFSRGQWQRSDETSSSLGREVRGRLAAGDCHGNERHSGLEVGYAGYCESQSKNRSGVRRGNTQEPRSERDRSPEGMRPPEDGLDRPAFLVRGNSERNGSRCQVRTLRSVEKIRLDVRVYNIGTRTENYFAEGILVHNCQDLAGIHHLLIDRVLSRAEEIWWIGDDDQAIFKFSGASAELFLERAKRAKVQIQLRRTRRFGQSIVNFSSQIISRVAHRHPKEIIGVSGREGKIHVTGAFEPIVGDVMILHRHVMGCQSVAQAYIDAGLPFRNERGLDPLGVTKRIKIWEAIQELSKGKTVSASLVAVLIEDGMKSHVIGEDGKKVELVKWGAKATLEERIKGAVTLQDLVQAKVLTSEGARVIGEKNYQILNFTSDLRYYDRLKQNGYALEYEGEDERKIPRITTIHGAKGRQAEQTVVFTEMSGKCWDDYETEHRLAYVAATRTETDVTICMESRIGWARDEYDYPVQQEAAK